MAHPADSDLPTVERHVVRSPLKFDPWLAMILACFILLAFVSWGKLAHMIFDIGNELEIDSGLLAGQKLYRDLQTNYGPLAYYANALALLLFGRRLEVIYGVGLVLALAATLLIYRMVKQLTNARWAALCTVYVLIYCAFNPQGLFNLIVPYSYGLIYATVLCLVAFTALDRYGYTGRIGWLVAAAIACGLAGLAKQEYGVASLLSVLVGANLCSPKNLRATVGRSVLVILVASVSVLLPFALLARQVSWEEIYTSLVPISNSHIFRSSGLFDVSLSKTLNVWKYSFDVFFATSLVVWAAIVAARWLSRREWIPSNRRIRNLVEILASIAFALLGLLVLQIDVGHTFKIILAALLLVWILALAGRWLSRREQLSDSRWLRILIKFVAMIAFIGLSWLILNRLACCSNLVFHPLGNLAWLLPLLVGWFAWDWRKLLQHRHTPLLWALLVFSVLLNARFLFYIDFYAIYGVTAVLLFFTFLYHFAVLTRLPVGRYLLVCLLITSGMNLEELAQYRYAVHSTHGTLHTKEANLALAFNHTIHYINDSRATSVLTIPAGAMLNFLTATHSPSREKIFLPGVLPTAEAEREFIARMQKNPPQLIVYVDVPFFWLKKGYQSYAEFNPLVNDWITHQHRLVYVSPKLVFGDKEWNIRVYSPNR